MTQSWRHVLTVYLSARIAASIAGLAGGASMPQQETLAAAGYAKQAYPKLFEMLFGIWERADTLWYLHIARDGYDPSTHDAVFFPFFPFLIKLVNVVTLGLMPWIVSGLIVSNAACILALYFVYRLAEIELGEPTARKATWYLMFFPGSFFFLVPYTESTFVALAAGALLAARTGRWWQAGLAAAALALTRNLGAAIVVPLLIEWLRAPKPKRRFLDLVPLALVPLALGGWMLYWNALSGDPLAFIHKQGSGWERQPMMPWSTWLQGMVQAWEFALKYPGGVYVLEAFAVLSVTVLGLIGFRRVPYSWSMWVWIAFIPAFVAPFPGRMLMSCVRFMAVLFPVFATLALLTRTERSEAVVRAVLTALFGLTAALYVANQFMF